jgi:hypothetical protein
VIVVAIAITLLLLGWLANRSTDEQQSNEALTQGTTTVGGQ